MTEKKIQISKKLTPFNAKRYGYEFAGNVIYQADAPKGTMSEIEDLVLNKNYKLGQGMTDASDLFVGLYKKL